MKVLKAIYGYTLALLGVPLVLFGIMGGSSGLDGALISATGLTHAPTISGGEVVQTIDHGPYQTQVHRLVFDMLYGERNRGFIQVDWRPVAALPALIDEEIDADGDGQADFRVEVNPETKETRLTPYAEWVLDVEGTYRLEEYLAVRVKLRNPG